MVDQAIKHVNHELINLRYSSFFFYIKQIDLVFFFFFFSQIDEVVSVNSKETGKHVDKLQFHFTILEGKEKFNRRKRPKTFSIPLAKIGRWTSRTLPRIGRTRESTFFNRGVNCNALI